MKMKTVKGAHHHLTIYNPLDARRRKTHDHFATRAKHRIQMRAHTHARERNCVAVSVCTNSAHIVYSSEVCFSLSIRCYFFGASVFSAESLIAMLCVCACSPIHSFIRCASVCVCVCVWVNIDGCASPSARVLVYECRTFSRKFGTAPFYV